MSIAAVGAFIKGATDKAAEIKAQQKQEDEQKFRMMMDMFNTLSQSQRPDIAGQAQDAAVRSYMEYLGYKHAAPKNAIHKLAEQFIGQQKDFSGAQGDLAKIQQTAGTPFNPTQEGVGKGNGGTSPVGGIFSPSQPPPAAPGGSAPGLAMPPGGPPPPPPDMDQGVAGTYTGMAPQGPPMPQTPLDLMSSYASPNATHPSMIPGGVDVDPLEEQLRTKAEAAYAALQQGYGLRKPSLQESQAIGAYQKYIEDKSKSSNTINEKLMEALFGSQRDAIKAHQEGVETRITNREKNTVTAPIDITDGNGNVLIPKGQPFDERIHSIITAQLKAQNPDLDIQQLTSVDGHKYAEGIYKDGPKKGQIAWKTDLGEAAEGIKGPYEETVKIWRRDHPGQELSWEENKKILDVVARTGAVARIEVQTAAREKEVGAKDPTVLRNNATMVASGVMPLEDIKRNGGAAGVELLNNTVEYMVQNNIPIPVPLTPKGSETLAQVQPMLQMIGRIRAEIEPYRTSNVPFPLAVSNALYALGMKTGDSDTIAGMSLARVMGTARVLQGTTRNYKAWEKGEVHLPDPAKDSGALAWEKLNVLEDNLKDIMTAAYTYERKSGVTAPPPSTGITNEINDFLKNKK